MIDNSVYIDRALLSPLSSTVIIYAPIYLFGATLPVRREIWIQQTVIAPSIRMQANKMSIKIGPQKSIDCSKVSIFIATLHWR